MSCPEECWLIVNRIVMPSVKGELTRIKQLHICTLIFFENQHLQKAEGQQTEKTFLNVFNKLRGLIFWRSHTAEYHSHIHRSQNLMSRWSGGSPPSGCNEFPENQVSTGDEFRINVMCRWRCCTTWCGSDVAGECLKCATFRPPLSAS